MRPAPAIQLDGLSKSFRVRRPRGTGVAARVGDFLAPATHDVLAVDGLSFSIVAGERVAFIGPNGAGKSTTLKMLAGILKPDAGVARVMGYDPFWQRRTLAFIVGTVFGQRSQLWYQLPPRDTFRLLAHVYGLDAAVYRKRLQALMDVFGLAPFFDTPVRQLSLGERMRCEIAASLLHAPRVLFLDEPTIGLDVSAKALIQELLRAESHQDGVTLLLTSHDTGDIERICDRAVVINGGALLWDGSLAELRRLYLTTKRVTVWMEAERIALSVAGVRVVSSQGYRTELEVALAQASVGQALEAVQAQGPIRDVAVEDVPLDVVIRTLYASAAKKVES